jgi:cobalt-zinc-cadmium efflux system protein
MTGTAEIGTAHYHAPHGPQQASGEERRMLMAFGVTLTFMVIEAAGGVLSHSLALIADAGHMLVDAGSLLMAWAAFRLGRMAADVRRSYGYRRLEVLAALANGLTVIALSVWIIYEAALRLETPEAVLGVPMLGVAVLGLAANLVTLRILDHHGHDHRAYPAGAGHGHQHAHDHRRESNLNLRGATLHVLGDLLGSVAAILAAIIILATGWTPADPILSVAIALLIVVSGLKVVRSATHILLEGSPEGFDPGRMRQSLLAEVEGLKEVHHLHAWSVTTGQHMLTLHAVVEVSADRDLAMARIKHVLAKDFGFSHSVVQLESDGCGDPGAACG